MLGCCDVYKRASVHILNILNGTLKKYLFCMGHVLEKCAPVFRLSQHANSGMVHCLGLRYCCNKQNKEMSVPIEVSFLN